MIHQKNNTILGLIIVLITASCGINSKKHNEKYSYLNTRYYLATKFDTIKHGVNMVDSNGQKQGVWVKNKNTVQVFHDDTLIRLNKFRKDSSLKKTIIYYKGKIKWNVIKFNHSGTIRNKWINAKINTNSANLNF